MSAKSIAIVAYVACTFGVALAQAQPSPSPTQASPPPASATAAPSPSPSPTPSDTPTPSASATASPTPYVRRYFNGRPIDTPEPSASPSVSPGASESPATGPTPYVRRYFNGRPIDTPAPDASSSASTLPSLGPTPYVRRFYQGKLIATPPPSPSPSVLASATATASATSTAAPAVTAEPTTLPAPATTLETLPSRTSPEPSPIPTIRRYFNGRPVDANSPAPSPSPVAHSMSTSASGTDYLLGGTWQCTMFAGTELTHTFSRDEDATSLVVETKVVLTQSHTATLHEKFLHHRSGTWTAQLANGSFIVSAPEWTGDTWRFVGSSTEAGKKIPIAMIFKRLDTDVFMREFQRLQAGTWVNYAGETCRRAATK